jgi:hypothetical protein
MIAVIGLAIGVALGIFLHPDVPIWLQPYLPIAVVAALDAVVGRRCVLVSVACPRRHLPRRLCRRCATTDCAWLSMK